MRRLLYDRKPYHWKLSCRYARIARLKRKLERVLTRWEAWKNFVETKRKISIVSSAVNARGAAAVSNYDDRWDRRTSARRELCRLKSAASIHRNFAGTCERIAANNGWTPPD